MNKNNIALVLEGGGAKCAYQVGAIIALEQHGFSFDTLSGASFGALNSALYIQGGVQSLLSFYENLKITDVINDEEICNFIESYQGDGSDFLTGLMNIMQTKDNVIEQRKIWTKHYHNLLRSVLEVSKIKESDKQYFCTVLKVQNNPITIGKLLLFFKNRTDLLSLYRNGEIEGGVISKDNPKLEDYIVASANYPTYAPIEIDNHYYLDGGIYDNVPYKHLIYKGYHDIVIIRTHPEDLLDYNLQNPGILVLKPSKNIGHALDVKHDRMMELIKMGYEETINKLKEIEQ